MKSPARLCLLTGLLSFLFALGVADTQVVFGDEPSNAMTDQVDANLLRSGIWVERNKTETPDSTPALHCCNILYSTFPGQVHFPDSAEYQAQQASYYQQMNADLAPGCRVTPKSAAEVSAIVSLTMRYECRFAVRSGGHMVSPGSSNADTAGFTIDLQHMNTVSVKDGGIVSFGAGCRWQEVYSVLQPLNLTTAGARAPGVGVAGFLLGGGISALSLEHGFGSSNIINYQVVLADGAIHNVNAHTFSDLFWALKYGSTNYAIVTRFDMSTHPLPATFTVDFTYKLAKGDSKGLNLAGIAWEPVRQTYIAWSPNIYLGSVPAPADDAAPYIAYPALWDGIERFIPRASINTLRRTDFLSIIREFEDMAPHTARAEWFTLTLKPDDAAQLMIDIHAEGVKMFEPYLNRMGFSWTVLCQPLNRGLAATGETRNGGNPSGLVGADGDLILFLITVNWADPADDAVFNAQIHNLGQWAERTARERNLLHPFIYMNYASGRQEVMGSIGGETLRRMREIKSVYDPANRFGELWRGGFKL